jgi:carboxymethylenebutenolidase
MADPTAVFNTHFQAELHADLAGTLATMVAEPHLLNLGSGTGGLGAAGVREFYATKLIGQFFPPDVEFIPISSTVNGERLVDEMVIRFTHSEAMNHLLPGVPATGRRVEMALVVVVGIDDGKVAYEHIYWDQAGLLAQLGLLDPTGLPVDPTAAGRLLAFTGKG